VALNLRAVSATAFTKIFGESPTKRQDACTTFCGANRFAARANDRLVADDQGLRLLEFIDRRATERELSILRKTIVHKCRARETSEPRNRPFATQGLFSPASSWSSKFRWLRSDPPFQLARMENLAVDSNWRNAFVFVDGKAPGR